MTLVKDAIKKYNPSRKTIDLVEDLFLQGDSRYYNDYEIVLLAGFLENKGVSMGEKILVDIKTPNDEDMRKVREPQSNLKCIAVEVLKRFTYKLKGFEMPLYGFRVDVLAEDTQNKLIAVECGPCYPEKVIKYLEEKEIEQLWLINPHLIDEFNKNTLSCKLIIIKRGSNWKKMIESHQNDITESLKEITSPLDRL